MTAPSTVSDRYRLTQRPGSATRILRLCDDPDSAAADLASAIATDPLFAAKVLRVANSTYYGLSGRVSNLTFAVSVVGFQGVRALAAATAAGLDGADAAPERFWEAAALCAVGAEMVAPMLGAVRGDAFITGLLHTIGAVLMHQNGEQVDLCLPECPDAEDRAGRGQAGPEPDDDTGMTHEALGALALAEWHFPAGIHEVIGRHHRAATPACDPLERTLHIARSLTTETMQPGSGPTVNYGWLSEGRIGEDQRAALLHSMADRSAVLLDGLLSG